MFPLKSNLNLLISKTMTTLSELHSVGTTIKVNVVCRYMKIGTASNWTTHWRSMGSCQSVQPSVHWLMKSKTCDFVYFLFYTQYWINRVINYSIYYHQWSPPVAWAARFCICRACFQCLLKIPVVPGQGFKPAIPTCHKPMWSLMDKTCTPASRVLACNYNLLGR